MRKFSFAFIPLFFFSITFENYKLTNNNKVQEDLFFENENLKVLIVGCLQWQDSANLRSFSKIHHTNATLLNMYAALNKIAAASNSASRFLFYYAGHGFFGKDTTDKSSIYFANYDIQYHHTKSTGFNISCLADIFSSKFKGSQFLFLADCCKSGGLIEIAKKISRSGAKAAAVTSCTSSDISTANWTYTQKLIEALKGDGFMNTNSDHVISFHELACGIDSAMKYNERQKAASAFFNWNENEPVNSHAQVISAIRSKYIFNGEYVFAKKNNAWWQTQVTGETANAFICRYYDYSDYEELIINKDSIKIPYFINMAPGNEVIIQRRIPRKAKVIAGDDDFAYTIETETNAPGWYTYEWLLTGDEQTAKILNDKNLWHDGKILEKKPGAYYVSYTDKDFTWDEWVSIEKVKE
jgi:hypothetical protein